MSKKSGYAQTNLVCFSVGLALSIISRLMRITGRWETPRSKTQTNAASNYDHY